MFPYSEEFHCPALRFLNWGREEMLNLATDFVKDCMLLGTSMPSHRKCMVADDGSIYFELETLKLIRDIALKALLALKILLLLPVVITCATLSLSIFSIIDLNRKTCAIINHNKNYTLPEKPPEKLSICSFNTALLPDFASINNSFSMSYDEHAPERVDKIAKEIIRRDDDIVCLQEVFQFRTARKLCQLLKDKYPFCVINVAQNTFKLGSGLAVFSKYPLENVKFHSFSKVVGTDYWANKGVVGVTAKLTEKHRINLFNTHLNSNIALENFELVPKPEQYSYYRRRQLNEMHSFMKLYEKEGNPKSLHARIVCGDLNIWKDDADSKRENYGRFFKKYDCFYNGFVDYILLKKKHQSLNITPIFLSEYSHDRMGSTSDHDAAYGSFQINS
jgi:exonuclease III